MSMNEFTQANGKFLRTDLVSKSKTPHQNFFGNYLRVAGPYCAVVRGGRWSDGDSGGGEVGGGGGGEGGTVM